MTNVDKELKALDAIDEALRDNYIDKDVPSVYKHIKTLRNYLKAQEETNSHGLTLEDVRQVCQDNGTDYDEDIARQALELYDDAYDYSGDGLHGEPLLEYCLEEICGS